MVPYCNFGSRTVRQRKKEGRSGPVTIAKKTWVEGGGESGEKKGSTGWGSGGRNRRFYTLR